MKYNSKRNNEYIKVRIPRDRLEQFLEEHDKHIIGEFATTLLNVFSNSCDFYEMEDMILEAIEKEKIDSIIYKCLEEQNK